MTHRFPTVTVLLGAASAITYWAAAASGADLCLDYGFVAARPTVGSALTSLFVHDPADSGHLIGNLCCLLLFGLVVEQRLGGGLCVLVYGLAGVAGAWTHGLLDPSATAPLVGASGAIFGLAAFGAAVAPRLAGFAVGLATWNLYLLFAGAEGTVSIGCHLGGFSAGFLCALVYAITRKEAA